jgi:hydroxymethylglutaryl-CoA lyase
MPPEFDRLPGRVTVYEVGPRDGLQNERKPVPTDIKCELIARLASAGASVVEATSFVKPEWVPQLADAEQVMSCLAGTAGPRYPVLVPNRSGLERAIAAGVGEVCVFGSATETFSRKNLNRSIAESFEMFAPVVDEARSAGLSVRGYLSMAFGDPWEGAVSPKSVAELASRLFGLGVCEVSLGDTIGVATPADVSGVIDALDGLVSKEAVAVHFHDTYGQGLSNSLTALFCGITTFDTSVGGLGGCPFAKSATGNLATEDLVYMLNGLDVETGLCIDRLVDTAWWINDFFERSPVGRVAQAMGRQRAPG